MAPKPPIEPGIAEAFNACADQDRCFWQMLTLACTTLNVQAGTFFEWDPAGRMLHVAHTHGILLWRVAKGEFPTTQGICGWVAEHLEPAMVNDVGQDERFNGQIDLMTQFKTVSVLCLPVLSGSRLFGVLELINRQNQPFTDQDLAAVQQIAIAAAARANALA